MKLIAFVLAFFSAIYFGGSLFSQVTNTGLMDTSSGLKIGNVSLGVYMDVYYGFNFNEPNSGENNYFVSANQHNSF